MNKNLQNIIIIRLKNLKKLLAFLFLIHLGTGKVQAQNNVDAITLIPDVNFEQALIDWGSDDVIDGQVLTTNISGLTGLDVSNYNIADLTGIQDFLALTTLYCAGNDLTTLDLTSTTQLSYIDCNSNYNLANINLTGLTNLTAIDCYYTALISLDFTTCTNLNYVDCDSSQLSTLRLNPNSPLTGLYCYNNQLTYIDVSSYPNLTSFNCDSNALTYLDISNNNSLTYFTATNNPFLSCVFVADLVAATNNGNWYVDTTDLYSSSTSNTADAGTVSGDQTITLGTQAVAINAYPNIGNVIYWQKSLDAAFTAPIPIANATNTLTGTEMGNLTVTTYFRTVVQDACSLANATNYVTITVTGTGTGGIYTLIPDSNFEQGLINLGIDIDAIPNGKVLTSAISGITTLDVSDLNIADLTGIQDFVSLTSLNCSSNTITSLDLGSNTGITILNCRGNQLTSIDLSPLVFLTVLNCSSNALSSLDLAANTNLIDFSCFYNSISSLNLGTNVNLTFLSVFGNPLSSLNIATLTNLTQLDVRSCQLTELDVSHNPQLVTLEVGYNLLTSLNVDANPNLFRLGCENNQITSLVGTENLPNLDYINCSSNLLTNTLSVCGSANLFYFYCWGNNLTGLDVRNNSNLNFFYTELLGMTNPNLTTIFVTNVANANAQPNWLKPASTIYSTSFTVGNLTSNQTICAGSLAENLVLSGNNGRVVKWQKATDSIFSFPTDIPNTTTTLEGAALGAISSTTYLRAVIQDGSCEGSNVNSNYVTILVGESTSWDGFAWSNGVPTSTTAVTITGNYSATNDLDACSLTIKNNAIVTVNSGHDFNVSGAVTVGPSSSLTFENNANLIQTGTVNSNIGNVVLKRKSSPLMRLDYILWSSPVANQNLLSFSPLTLSTRFYTYNPIGNATNPNGLYNAIQNLSSVNFNTAQGYLIRMPNTHPTTPTIWEGQFNGVPNNGNYTTAIMSGAYNALGNPYPSVIDANLFINSNTISEAIYFWRKTNNELMATNPTPSYATYTTLGGTANTGGFSSIAPTRYIQLGQGFIIKSNTATISFTNAMRVLNKDNLFLRSNAEDKNRFWLNLTSENFTANQMMIGYCNGATEGIDPAVDGRYINDSPVALNSLVNNEEFVIQGRALPFDTSDTVPLSFKTNIPGNYTISIDHVDGFFLAGQAIYLKDNFTNTYHNLSLAAYSFASEIGTFTSRFAIVYQNPLTNNLPVFNKNSVVVYKQNNEIVINTGKVMMSSVKIMDIEGRVLVEQLHPNSCEVRLFSGGANQVVLVQICTDKGDKVTKKIVN